jgi:tRNA modification GTPase
MSTPTTIVALATPPGRAGLAVVRLSGPDAFCIVSSLLAEPTPLEPRRAVVARVRGACRPGGPGQFPEGELRVEMRGAGQALPGRRGAKETRAAAAGWAIDQAVVLPFRAPASYTGEDVVELSLHGSMAVVAEVIDAAVKAGAVMAGPGEFTLRAFLNGRLDLAQAEAVRDLVDAATPLQARVACDQLTGMLSGRIAEVERELFSLAARLEASIDFPDEGYRFVAGGEARAAIERAATMLEALLATSARGRVIREGATVAIAGRPNVGKSSLFNRLIGSDRAIVHQAPGTTRDLLTETVTLGGLRVTLADTAGVRESDDLVEREGVARAARAHAAADLVLLVLDGSEPLTAEDRRLLELAVETPAWLVVANKADLPAAWDVEAIGGAVRVSCVDGSGVDALSRLIARTLAGEPGGAKAAAGGGAGGAEGEGVAWRAPEPVVLTNARHVRLVEEARRALGDAATLLANDPAAPEEIVLSEIQRAREALEQVTGKRTTDDLLREIFSTFCVGK